MFLLENFTASLDECCPTSLDRVVVSYSRVGCPALPSDEVDYAGGTVKSTAPVLKPGKTRRCFGPTVLNSVVEYRVKKGLENQLVLKVESRISAGYVGT